MTQAELEALDENTLADAYKILDNAVYEGNTEAETNRDIVKGILNNTYGWDLE